MKLYDHGEVDYREIGSVKFGLADLHLGRDDVDPIVLMHCCKDKGHQPKHHNSHILEISRRYLSGCIIKKPTGIFS